MSFHPQTPQSPSHYSPGTSEPLSSMNTSMTSSAGTLPTPAHSVNGSTIGADLAHDLAMGGVGDDSPQKRKRLLDDLGEQGEQKKAHVEDRRLGIEKLHLDVGEKYLLCRTRKTPCCSRALWRWWPDPRKSQDSPRDIVRRWSFGCNFFGGILLINLPLPQHTRDPRTRSLRTCLRCSA